MQIDSFPRHVRLMASAEVWMEGAALEQLARVAGLPGCVRAVGMPDLHPGKGHPVGAAFAFAGRIRPSLIGGDAGCGARVCVVPRSRFDGEALLRRVESATEGPPLPEADPLELLEAVWRAGPRGLARVAGVPAALAELAELEPAEPELGPMPEPEAELGRSLGSIGGGNHFVELGQADKPLDAEAAAGLGLRRGAWVVLAHSGSRGLGQRLARRWGEAELTEPERMRAYLGELEGACRYARANRLILVWRALEALGAARPERQAGGFDVLHNTVVPAELAGEPVWLHRKGSAPAEAGRWTVVLASRGSPSVLMQGLGNEEALWSIAHGAGRKMGRSEAIAKLTAKYPRAALAQLRGGSRVICDETELLYAEHPDAYKPIDPVIQSLTSANAAQAVVCIHPKITLKR